ncbi:MAG: stage II sporulation protein R [Clostridia bacterium]|nr:stage II sporulation protein R [Clostridia bacterium]
MKFKHILVIIILFIIFIFSTIISYSNSVFAGLENNIFRLHILANSNSEKDQALKLKVRDGLLDYMKEINNNSSKKTETIQNTKNHINEIKAKCLEILEENGSNYDVHLEIGNFYFPTKHYGNISLPAGNYDALRIIIGEGKGQNWWCSLFPPLCFIDISSGYLSDDDSKILEDNLTEEEFMIISNSAPDIKLKFKILELLNNK